MKTMQRIVRAVVTTAIVFSSVTSFAYEPGDLVFRAGPANVDPDSSSGPIRLGGTALAGTSVDVDDNTQLGLTFTYMLRDHLALGLLAATPFEHDISESGVGVINVGSTKHLPPTLTLQYFPAPADSVFQPYVGAGLNYTTFFSEKTSAELNAALGNSSMSLDDSFGLALEAGFDYGINDKWSLNAAVWVLDIDTEATIQTGAGLVEVDVEIDPVVFMVGAGYRF
jgi:outer membrane protein